VYSYSADISVDIEYTDGKGENPTRKVTSCASFFSVCACVLVCTLCMHWMNIACYLMVLSYQGDKGNHIYVITFGTN
jgi:hypothetical protein